MAKKEYSSPSVNVYKIQLGDLMQMSGGNSIKLTGTYEEGDASEATSKKHYNVWEDEQNE